MKSRCQFTSDYITDHSLNTAKYLEIYSRISSPHNASIFNVHKNRRFINGRYGFWFQKLFNPWTVKNFYFNTPNNQLNVIIPLEISGNRDTMKSKYILSRWLVLAILIETVKLYTCIYAYRYEKMCLFTQWWIFNIIWMHYTKNDIGWNVFV